VFADSNINKFAMHRMINLVSVKLTLNVVN